MNSLITMNADTIKGLRTALRGLIGAVECLHDGSVEMKKEHEDKINLLERNVEGLMDEVKEMEKKYNERIIHLEGEVKQLSQKLSISEGMENGSLSRSMRHAMSRYNDHDKLRLHMAIINYVMDY